MNRHKLSKRYKSAHYCCVISGIGFILGSIWIISILTLAKVDFDSHYNQLTNMILFGIIILVTSFCFSNASKIEKIKEASNDMAKT